MSRPDRRNPRANKARFELDAGREAYARRSWAEAYRMLSRADQTAALGVQDCELLATAAYLVGRDDDYLKTVERCHRAYLDAGEGMRAARCAFWLGLRLMFRGEIGPATGWFGRARRLVESEPDDCVEQGYLMLPLVQQHLMSGDWAAAHAAASGAADIATRFADGDLLACALHLQGRVLLRQQEVARGLALLDEAMVAVSAGELSPIMTGLVYCSVIEACQEAFALDRAREWTSALAQWCAEQPELVSFTGSCLMHRAEIMQLSGAWQDAIAEAQRACERLSHTNNRKDTAAAFYRQAEVYRLRGEFAAAEQAYRSASESGSEPQPGLALLRSCQGRADAAAAMIRRTVNAISDRLHRLRLLPAYIEIMLAIGDRKQALDACRELEQIAAPFKADVLAAMVSHARGAVELAEGDAQAAVVSLRHAWQIWHQVEAPYEAARARALLGLAYRALGDDDGAAFELQTARAAFQQLGAMPDVSRVDSLRHMRSDSAHGLSARELQVLRLIAAGKTNKAIANALHLSGRTVDRHVSNIFNKLDVASRAAATAWAYEHKLV